MAKDNEFFAGQIVGGDAAPSCEPTTNDIALLEAIELPIIVISRDCRVSRINRAATTVLGLAASDVGRSLGQTLAGIVNLDRICTRVIADGAPHRIETRDGDRRFLVRIAPYIGTDHQIQGALVTFTNVTAFRASIDQAIYDREYTKAILNTVVDPLVVLDDNLRVQTANRAFYAMFRISRDETQGLSIRQLGNSEWEVSGAWKSVETLLSDHTEFQPVEIEREFAEIGCRTLVLDARRLTRDANTLILLSFRDITERKQAEATTSLLAAIVDFSDDAIISKKLNGTITSWNNSAERMFGYTSQEAIGQHITLIVPWERRSEEEEILRRLAGGERLDHFETVRRRRDGTAFDVSLTISPIRDSAGRVVGASNAARDITERKRDERALRESEERFRAIVETTPECVKLISIDGTLLHMNSPGLQMVGAHSADEVINKSVYELIAPVDRDRFKAFNESVCHGQRGSLQFDIIGLEGKRRQMETHAAPLRNSDGTVVHLAITADVSERRRAEELLRGSEERFRALVNASSDVVYRMSPDWSEMRQLDGRGFIADSGKARKDWLNEYIHPDDQALVLQTIREAVLRKSTFQLEHRVRRADGTLGWTYLRAVPLLDANGEILEWFGAASDVTRRKEAETSYRKLAESLEATVQARTEELEQRNTDVLRQSEQVRELSRRLLHSQDEERRHIARELHDSAGQTLTVLGMSLSELIQKARRTSPELATEAESTQELVQQLHREIRTTSYLLHPPLLDENGLPSALTWYIEGLRERSDVGISLCISEDIGRLPGDMELVVFRVVQECLTNIHRHSGSKTAFIRLARDSEKIVVEVRDTGSGMPPEKLAELQLGGSGVGIRGMRERVHQLGGNLRVDSDNSGTRVSVTIPTTETALEQETARRKPLQAAL
ncbi:MAG: PAS domain-containing sensor histidine kinase [Candidatus Acidiferrales bacterium]